MKRSKKLLVLTITVAFLIFAFAICGFAAEKSGKMLANGTLSYELSGGTLTISGTAETLKFDSALSWDMFGSIWHDEGWHESITEVVVNAAIKEIDAYVLSLLPSCERITLPSSVKKLGLGALAGNSSLMDIRISGKDYSDISEEHFYDLRDMTDINGYAFDTTAELAEAPVLLLGRETSIGFEKFMQRCWEQEVSIYVYPNTETEIKVIEASINTLKNDAYYHICDNIAIKYYASAIEETPLKGEIVTSDNPGWTQGIVWELDTDSGTLYVSNTNGSISFNEYSSAAHSEFSAWKNIWKNAVRRIEVGPFDKICTWSLLSDYPYCTAMLFTKAFELEGTNLPNNKSLTTVGYIDNYEEGVADVSMLRYKNESWHDGAELFYGCTSVTNVKFPEENLLGSYIVGSSKMFYGCTSLESITLPAYFTKLASEMFGGCTSLKLVYLKNADITIASNTFSGCYGVKIYVQSMAEAESVNLKLKEAGIDTTVAYAESTGGIELDSGMRFDGYQIRTSKYNGIRTLFSYDESVFNKNDGFSFVEYGTIAASAAVYAEYAKSIGEVNSILIHSNGEFISSEENIIKIKVRDKNGYHNSINENEDGSICIKTVIVRFEGEENIKTDVITVGYEIWERNGKYYAVFTEGSYGKNGEMSLYKATLGMLKDGTIELGRSASSPVWKTLQDCTSAPVDSSYEGISVLTYEDPEENDKSIAVLLNETSSDILLDDVSFLKAELRKGLSGYIFEESIGCKVRPYYSYADIVSRLINADHLALTNVGERSGEFTSYDRDSKLVGDEYVGWNENDDFGGYIRKDSDGGYVIAEMDGPGYISRIWAATPLSGHIRIFIDGSEDATIDMPFEDIFSGTAAPFDYSELSYNKNSGQGKNCYVPITYNESCKVVLYEGWGEYYMVNYTTLPEGSSVESMPSELTEADRKALGKVNDALTDIAGLDPMGKADPAFEEFTVSSTRSAVKTFSGKGSIRGLLINIDHSGNGNDYENVLLLKNLQIKIYWDGMEEPFVDAPLGDFFGSAYGFTSIRTLMLGIREDGTFYNYFTMPYLSSARIEISYSGEGSVSLSMGVNVEELKNEDIMYYSALFNRGEYAEDPNKHPDYNFLTVEGSGRLVGLTLHSSKSNNDVDPESVPGYAWWGEGDEKFYIDGETFPSWYGTGTEDFFGYAWCDGTLFNRAYHSQSYCVGGANHRGNRSITRIMLSDNLPFEESFDGYFEKYYRDEYVKYGFTAYFYMSSQSKAVRDDYSSEDLESYFYFDPGTAASNFTEGEHLRVNSISDGGEHSVQQMSYFGSSWSEDGQIFITGLAEGGEIEFVLPAEGSGKYVLLASFTSAPDFGKVKLTVNGAESENTFDLYDPSVVANELSYVGVFDITRGFKNTMKLTVVGKNSSSTNYYAAIDFVLLVPEDEFTTLAEFDLSQYTTVIRTNTKN